MTDKKRYTLIELDTGFSHDEEKAAGSKGVPEQEETIVVSSGNAPSRRDSFEEETVRVGSLSEEELLQSGHLRSKMRDDARSSQLEHDEGGEGGEDDEGVPFQRMQAIIVICLIVIIVAFLVYFNFLR